MAVHYSARTKQSSQARKATYELLGHKCDRSGKVVNTDVTHDILPVDEEVGESTHPPNTGPRKRRKLIPKEDALMTPLVFDDASLQRHIAEEVRRESEAASVPGEAAQMPATPEAFATKKSYAVNKKIYSAINASSTESLGYSDLNVPMSADTIKSKDAAAVEATKSNFPDQTATIVNASPYKILGNRKDSTSLQTVSNEKSIQDLSASSREKSKASQEEQISPSTPPRHHRSMGIATTPKQMELWRKLLFNDPPYASPKDLDLPGLSIKDQPGPEYAQAMHSPIEPVAGAIDRKPAKRSAKLIDFLTTSDGDRSTSDQDYTEEGESSGADQSKSVHSNCSISDEILTMQTSPSASSHDKRPHLHVGLAPGPPNVSLSQGIPKVTYIRERTHLGDNDYENAGILDVPLVAEKETPKNRSWAAPSSKHRQLDTTKDIYHELGALEDSQAGPMRSIHELRESGGNTRLVGELEAILDDLDGCIGSSTSARRTLLMSLASKLIDASTCRMFTDQGLEPRLLAQLDFGDDIIERSLLAASILQILFNTTSAAFYSPINRVKTMNLLVGLLGHTKGLPQLARLREINMSRLTLSELDVYCSSFVRSLAWRTLKPPVLTGQIVALYCLDLLVRQAREGGCMTEILSADAINHIAETTLPSPGISHTQTSCSRICSELAISILENCSISGTAGDRDPEWTDQTLERISETIQFLGKSFSHDHSALQTMTLRLYLNLTNVSPRLCERFSKPNRVDAIFNIMLLQFNQLSKPEGQRQNLQLLDQLVLSLGCLINLAESSDAMRRLVMVLKMEKDSFLEILLRLFVQNRRKAAEVLVSPLVPARCFANRFRHIPRKRPRTMLHSDIYLSF